MDHLFFIAGPEIIAEPLPPLAINIHVTVDQAHESNVAAHFNMFKGKGTVPTQQAIEIHLSNVNPQTFVRVDMHYFIRGWICKMTLSNLAIATNQLIPQRDVYDEAVPHSVPTTSTANKIKKRKVISFE